MKILYKSIKREDNISSIKKNYYINAIAVVEQCKL